MMTDRSLAFREGLVNTAPSHLSRAMGDFLHRFPWEWWGTITFRREIVSYAASRHVRQFLMWLERQRKGPVGAFIAVEMHKYRGEGDPASLVPHVHFLALNVAGMSRRAAWKYLYDHCGRSRIEPYDPDRGASHYIAKYVGKECLERGEWDFWRPEVIQAAGKPLWVGV